MENQHCNNHEYDVTDSTEREHRTLSSKWIDPPSKNASRRYLN